MTVTSLTGKMKLNWMDDFFDHGASSGLLLKNGVMVKNYKLSSFFVTPGYDLWYLPGSEFT
jgi:hypothetical protein